MKSTHDACVKGNGEGCRVICEKAMDLCKSQSKVGKCHMLTGIIMVGHRRYRRRWLRSRANVPFGRSTYYPFQMTGEHRFEASRMVLFPGLLLLANGTIARAAEARSMFRKSTVTTMSAALILLANALGAQAAGFDCSVARTAMQKRICADPVLSNLDGTMKTVFDRIEGETYGHDADTGGIIDPLGKDQARWIETVRDHCVDTACLIEAYRDRLNSMRRKWPDILADDETDGIIWAPEAQSWKTYSNVRYRYAICYPSGLLKPGPESDNGDGLLFSAASGASLRVWGAFNAAHKSLAALARDLADPSAEITYRHLTKTSATVSGRKGGDILYARTLVEQGVTIGTVVTFILAYPADQAATYDPVATKLSSCLHVLQGGALQ